MKKLLVLVLAACMATMMLASLAFAGEDDKVYELNVSFAAPEFSTMGITESLDRIQEASNGRLVFNYYYSWSLASVATVVDDLNSGVVDIAAVPINEHLNTFPYSNLITYTPFLPLPGMKETAALFNEMYEEYDVLQQEYSNLGLHYWTNYPCAPYNIYTTSDHAIKNPEDLKGLKLITSSRLMSEFVDENGGAVVNSPVTDYATNLNTNVVDGVINHVNVLAAFGCIDFINAVTDFGDSGTAMNLMMMCISQSVWDSLPEDLQALFNDEAEGLMNGQGDDELEMRIGNTQALVDKGAVITELSDEEVQVWRDAFAEKLDSYIEELESQGSDQARELYDALIAKLGAE